MLERVLDKVREDFIPESARDFNMEICYGGETSPADIVNRAQSLPFMSQNRLMIVRRVEELKAAQLEVFLPYLDNPSPVPNHIKPLLSCVIQNTVLCERPSLMVK